MCRSLLSLLLVVFFAIGCQRAEIQPARRGSASPTVNPEIPNDDLFTPLDQGEPIALKRQSNATARNIADSYSPYSYYGYGYQNPFLAFADYVRWLDYTISSVVKLRFGSNTDLVQTLAVVPTCWNFTITSSHPLTVERIDQRASAGHGTMTETSQNQITIAWTIEGGRGGLVFAIHSNSGDIWDYPSHDPYLNGYSGYYNDWYYYYPANPNSFHWEPKSLRISGTANACHEAILPTDVPFDIDLSAELNNYPGYMPYFKKAVASDKDVSGRIINFDGMDWWY